MIRKWLPITAFAVTLVLLITTLAAMQSMPEVKAAGTASNTEDTARWVIQCVDCPKQFGNMTDRSLRLDAAGHPHMAYGGDHLYYAWHDGSTWHYETADGAPGVGAYASLALGADGQPHIGYYDETNGDLKYTTTSLQPDLSASFKEAEPRRAEAGERISYTLQIVNLGPDSTAFTLDDPVPAHTTYVPGSAWASSGQFSDAGGILWSGDISAGSSLTATFAVTIDGNLTQPTAIVNAATLEGDPAGPLTLRAGVIVDAYEFFLPLVLRNGP